jgi:hypothetical protein
MHAFVHKNVYAYVCMYASVYACMRGTMYDSPHDILYHLYAYTNTFALEKCSPQFFFHFLVVADAGSRFKDEPGRG